MTEPSALSWLNDILWPSGDAGFVAGTRCDGPTWWASPTVDSAQTLMPTGPRAAARRAVRRYHDGQSWRRRARSWAAEVVMAVPPAARRLPLGELVTIDGDMHTGVVGAIAGVLGVEDLTIAVSLAQPKSNRKPVLQLLAPDGRCLGFAKVAADDRTAALMENEATWLRRDCAAPVVVPELLFSGHLADRAVLLMSAVPAARVAPRRPADPPADAVFHAVAAMGDGRTGDLHEGAWWSRVDWLLSEATSEERERVLAVGDEAAGSPVALGAWHGDLTPWNLMTRGDRVHLIDWEYAADEVPVGFDLCHFHLQAGNETIGLPAGDALERAAALVPDGLRRLGVPADAVSVVWRLYLVELIRRFLELRRQGFPVERLQHGPAALARLALEQAGSAGPGHTRQRHPVTRTPVLPTGTDHSQGVRR